MGVVQKQIYYAYDAIQNNKQSFVNDVILITRCGCCFALKQNN